MHRISYAHNAIFESGVFGVIDRLYPWWQIYVDANPGLSFSEISGAWKEAWSTRVPRGTVLEIPAFSDGVLVIPVVSARSPLQPECMELSTLRDGVVAGSRTDDRWLMSPAEGDSAAALGLSLLQEKTNSSTF